MEQVIKLLEEKGIVEKLKRTTKEAYKIANFLEIEPSQQGTIKAISNIFLCECEKDDALFKAFIDNASMNVAEEIYKIINKEEKKND